jgi:hypothetical protein
MKLVLFLFTLFFSVHGWCASIDPSQRAGRAIRPVHQTIENGKLEEKTTSPLLMDKARTALIGWVLIAYLTAISWWVITARNSLDKILKDIIQDIAQY